MDDLISEPHTVSEGIIEKSIRIFILNKSNRKNADTKITDSEFTRLVTSILLRLQNSSYSSHVLFLDKNPGVCKNGPS